MQCAYLLHDARLSLGEGGVASQFVLDVLHLDLDTASRLLARGGLGLLVQLYAVVIIAYA